MDLAVLKDLAWRAMGTRISHPGREPGFVYYHGQRVAQIALQLRELIFPGEDSLDEVILVAGWFHDVGKGLEPHWEYGALVAREMLKDFCTPDELEKIVEMIAGHTLRKQREYPSYVQLLQDADILDHFGSLEVWLNFYHCASHSQGVDAALQFYAEEYEREVASVRSLINFAAAAEIFEEKVCFVRSFVERLRREARGEIVWDQKKAKD